MTTGSLPAAEAFAVKAGRFLAVGLTTETKKTTVSAIKLIDLKRRTVLPGLMDSHTHGGKLKNPLDHLCTEGIFQEACGTQISYPVGTGRDRGSPREVTGHWV